MSRRSKKKGPSVPSKTVYSVDRNSTPSQVKGVNWLLPGRSLGMDMFRGTAILLMIVDHVFGIWFDHSISHSPIRMLTRLSMPMFMVLAGYLLARSEGRIRPQRWMEIAFSAVAVNALVFPYFQRIDILGSFLVVLIMTHFLGKQAWVLTFGILIQGVMKDPSGAWFDYPISLIMTPVGIGFAYQRFGFRLGLLAALFPLLGLAWISDHTSLSLLAIPLAYLLLVQVQFLERSLTWLRSASQWAWSPLTWIRVMGQYPLRIYVAQYQLILLLKWIATNFQIGSSSP